MTGIPSMPKTSFQDERRDAKAITDDAKAERDKKTERLRAERQAQAGHGGTDENSA